MNMGFKRLIQRSVVLTVSSIVKTCWTDNESTYDVGAARGMIYFVALLPTGSFLVDLAVVMNERMTTIFLDMFLQICQYCVEEFWIRCL